MCQGRGESDYYFPSSYQEFDCGCVIYGQPTSGFLIPEMFDKTFKIKNNQLISLITNGETKVGHGTILQKRNLNRFIIF